MIGTAKDHRRQAKRTGESFNGVAPAYDCYRRRYPVEVVEALVALARIEPGSRVLEIGPGTGQLTRSLLERGAKVMAIELGPELAALAKANLADWPDFEMAVSSFEAWALPPEPFNAVVSATAFHWIDVRVRAVKSAQALRAGSVLAAFYPHYVRGDDRGFVRDAQPCYVRWGLSRDPEWLPPTEDALSPVYQDIDQCPDFSTVERMRIRKTEQFTTEEYIGWLGTDSLVLTLSASDRAAFLSDMTALIDSQHGGVVVRSVVYEIVAATKR